jgi:gliding motility-associated-like protein
MNRILLTFFLIVSSTIVLKAQTITIDFTPKNICPGSNIRITFLKNGIYYNPGNTFNITMSDASGSFSTPTILGSVSDTTISEITGEIPKFSPSGSGYRIRITSSSPSTTFTSTATLNVYPRPTASYTFLNDSQCYKWHNYRFTSNSTIPSGSINTYIWNWNDGISDTTTNNIINHKFRNFLFYYYPKLTVISNFGCTDSFSRQVNLKETPRVMTEFNDTIQCFKGNFFSIKSISEIYLGSITFKSWQVGTTGPSYTNIDSFSHSFNSDGSFQVRQINHHSNGCKDTSVLACLVNEHPKALIATNDTDQCFNGNYYIFESKSTINNGLPLLNYWTLDNNDLRNEQDSAHKTIIDEASDRTIQLITISDDGVDGCSDTAFQIILVNPMPESNIQNIDVSKCFKDNLFRFKSTSTITRGTISNNWNFGDLSTANNSDSVSHSYTSDGNYTVKVLTTSNKGCLDSATTTVNIKPTPLPSFSLTQDTICFKYHELKAYSNSSISSGTYTRRWLLSDGMDYAGVDSIKHSFTTHGKYRVMLVLNSNQNCRDTVSDSVVILPTPTSDFNVNNTDQCFRGNLFTFNDVSTFNSGVITGNLWIYGDGITRANAASTNHVYTTEDAFNSALIVYADNGCFDTSFQRIKVYPHPSSDFLILASGQCVNNNSIEFRSNTFITEGGFSNAWNFGDGGTSSLLSPFKKYNKDTTYNVRLISYSDIGCTDTAVKQVTIHPKARTSFSINNNTQCLAGNSFNFNSTTTIKSGTFTLNWQFGNGNISGNNSSVQQSYLLSQFYNVRLISSSNNGCLDTAIRQIRTLAMPVADYQFNTDKFCLQGNNFQFNQSSTNPGGLSMNHRWYYGNGDSLINSTTGQVSYLTPGTYNVSLVSSTNLGNCRDTSIKSFVVHPMPDASIQVNDNEQCFENNSFEFASTSTVSSGTIATTNWKFGDNTTSNLPDPIKSYFRSDSFRVSLIVLSNFGCLDSTFTKAYVNAMPIANFDINPKISCFKNNSIRIINRSSISRGLITEHKFYYGNGDSTDVQNPPNYSYLESGDYQILHKVVSNKGCEDTTSRFVYIRPNPELDFSVDPVCLKDSSIFINNSTIASGDIISWKWFFGNGRTSNAFEPKFKYRDTGSFDIRLVAVTDQGCVDTLFITNAALVFPNPKANFTYDKIRSWENEVDIRYRDLSTDAITWNWNFASMGTSTEQNPTLFYNDTLTQLTRLIVSNIYDCKDTSTQNIFILPDVIYYIPTAFSPNDDNINETFKPIGLAYALEYKFIVFNRWGEKLFETNNPKNGWNGKFNDKIVEQGLYFFRMEFIGANELRYEEKGNIMILY